MATYVPLNENLLHCSSLDENLFQGIIVASCTKLSTTEEWLRRIIDNAKNHPKLEFQPVLENGIKYVKFDVDEFESLTPLECHRALLDNKYYNTNIYLVPLDDIIYFPDKFYEFFHGALFYFDNNDEDGLKKLDDWMQYVDMMENCSIKILACETATERHPISRIEIQNYCIDRGFELVELKPFVEPPHNDDLEDDFKESNSFERLYQAIQAYVWPNLNYKQKGTDVSAFFAQTTNDDLIRKINQVNFDDDTPVSNETSENKAFTSAGSSNGKPGEKEVDEKEADKFEDIFSRFSDIKDEAAKLADEERRRFAEKMAIDFWNTLSDDKDEIAGFSSEEEAEPNHVYI